MYIIIALNRLMALGIEDVFFVSIIPMTMTKARSKIGSDIIELRPKGVAK